MGDALAVEVLQERRVGVRCIAEQAVANGLVGDAPLGQGVPRLLGCRVCEQAVVEVRGAGLAYIEEAGLARPLLNFLLGELFLLDGHACDLGALGDDVANGESMDLKVISKRAAQIAEKRVIEKVLGQTRWNRKEAAERLKISYKALLYKMKENGLSEGR